MLATCICLNGSLLDQLSCTIVYLHNLFTCTFGRINMSVCLSVLMILALKNLQLWPMKYTTPVKSRKISANQSSLHYQRNQVQSNVNFIAQ